MAVRVVDDGQGHVWISDSTDPQGPKLMVRPEVWQAFLEQVRAGVDYPGQEGE